MLKKWVMANWKMHGCMHFIKEYFIEINKMSIDRTLLELAIFPPYVYLDHCQQYIQKDFIVVGAQNVAAEESGAFTGEVAASMLQELQCRYVLVGHSERRQIFQEDLAMVSKKFYLTQNHGMMPVVCIGESLQDYQQGYTKAVLRQQLETLAEIADFSERPCIIAYEPIWAIGTGLVPMVDEIRVVFDEIEKILTQYYRVDLEHYPLLYGGSVNEKNVAQLMAIEGCRGVLVGGASLKVNSLVEMIKCITYC